jgi:hypothetical protein
MSALSQSAVLPVDIGTCAWSKRDVLLDLNNRNAQETSLLTRERLDQLIEWARVAVCVPPDVALLLAFDQSVEYDGSHFLWFRSRFDEFLYIDRVIVADEYRRHGIGRRLYTEVFARAAELGHTRVVCEVNLLPPNPVSDAFHASLEFREVGQAAIDNGSKTVRYLAAQV